MSTPPAGHQYDTVWRDVYGDIQELGPVHRHMRRLTAGLLAELDYRDALEVGCGAGHNLALLAGHRPLANVAGADVSQEALRRARQRSDGDLFELDIETAALEGTWDLVFSSLVLEHLRDDVGALRHMCAMSARHLLLTTIAGPFDRYGPWERQVGHVRNYRPGELEGKLEQAGATVQRAIYWGFPFYSPISRLAQNRWRAEPSFSRSTRLVAQMLHAVYRMNSSRRGDLLIVHATVA